MSIPLSSCLVSKAALGNEKAYRELVNVMRINTAFGSYTQIPCRHTPQCTAPSEEQLKTLNDRLAAEPVIRRAAEDRKRRENPEPVNPTETT